MQARGEKVRAIEVITDRADFLKIQNTGQKWVSAALILQVGRNDLQKIRVGYTVSRKVHKSAVMRNRIKRRLRAVAADVLSQHGAAGFDYVLVGRLAGAEVPYSVLVRDLIWCLKRTETSGAGV